MKKSTSMNNLPKDKSDNLDDSLVSLLDDSTVEYNENMNSEFLCACMFDSYLIKRIIRFMRQNLEIGLFVY